MVISDCQQSPWRRAAPTAARVLTAARLLIVLCWPAAYARFAIYSRLTLPGGRTARVEPPSHVLAQAERAARSPHLPDSVLAPRLAGLEEEVVSLHQKIDVLKEQLQAGMQTALECSAQVVRLAPPLLPRPRAALCAQWSRR